MLFRNAVDIFDRTTKEFYSDKVIIVTGGGGSIGSELCRKIASCAPRQLIVLDIYENNAFYIQQELMAKYGSSLDLKVEIGSVRDRARLDSIFKKYRPQIVIHAAAHKHVPLMENSCGEAIKNNVLGTCNAADAAEKYSAERFILISTDKAVNPTNVMGASKRLCERVIQCRADSETVFTAVRFGNVIGSNGSVISLFERQIAAGGPLTVTDKRATRFFMTISEAAGLVMQAGAIAKGGELFVLDMGDPVRIIDVAEEMIRRSGLIPYKDIDIVEIGLRPGEKLYEESVLENRDITRTENDMIFIERVPQITRGEVEEKLLILRRAARSYDENLDASAINDALKNTVPEFCKSNEIMLNK